MRVEPLTGRGLLGEDRFVDAPHGGRLRVMLAGEGDDLVVLEAGLGASGLYWGPVHSMIAQHARVVAYERAGYGASSPAPAQPRGLTDLSNDLQSVIATLPHRRLVLVGHSWGGPIVRTLAERYLAQQRPLDGVVLVDQSDEHAADLYTSRAARWSDAFRNSLMVPLARLQLLAPLVKTQVAGLPRPVLKAGLVSSGSVGAARASVAENKQIGSELQRLRKNPPVLGNLGISVISGQRHNRLDRRIRARLVQAHRETAAQYPGARFVAAENSGHMIPVTEPELIAAEALSFVA